LQIGRLGHPRNNEQKTSFGSEGWFKLILLKRLEHASSTADVSVNVLPRETTRQGK